MKESDKMINVWIKDNKWVWHIGARLMHVGDSSIYLNWLLENIYNKVPNSNSGKNYELL